MQTYQRQRRARPGLQGASLLRLRVYLIRRRLILLRSSHASLRDWLSASGAASRSALASARGERVRLRLQIDRRRAWLGLRL